MKKYDYAIIGAGLTGAVFAQQAIENGKKVLIIEKRDHFAGNAYTYNDGGIEVHKYGAHIFHTNDDEVWGYVNRFAKFNHFINSPIANYRGEIYSLPFNMYTFNKIWGVVTPEEAKERLKSEQKGNRELNTLEDVAISLIGSDIYEKLVKGYTEKQWGKDCKDLPPFIIKRLPVRFIYDNNYFIAKHQGIPEDGYTKMIAKMIKGADIQLGTDYLNCRDGIGRLAEKLIFTGSIDSYFNYSQGRLQYRSVRFETENLDTDNYQGNAVVNYTDRDVPYTRVIEHKWFTFGKDRNGDDIPHTIISREYSQEWSLGIDPYYPINDGFNNKLYEEYRYLAQREAQNVIFAGRLGEYKYYDMDAAIAVALRKCKRIFGKEVNG